jgi:outer membrane protein insertion porin family/translocation and assembly module TamA
MEIRFPIVEPLAGIVFVDTSDVSNEVAFIAFGSPHLSVGPGLRYNTPIGPLRLDVGYRVPGWQVRGGGAEDDTVYFPDTANIREFKNKIPIAYHIAIGEAF